MNDDPISRRKFGQRVATVAAASFAVGCGKEPAAPPAKTHITFTSPEQQERVLEQLVRMSEMENLAHKINTTSAYREKILGAFTGDARIAAEKQYDEMVAATKLRVEIGPHLIEEIKEHSGFTHQSYRESMLNFPLRPAYEGFADPNKKEFYEPNDASFKMQYFVPAQMREIAPKEFAALEKIYKQCQADEKDDYLYKTLGALVKPQKANNVSP